MRNLLLVFLIILTIAIACTKPTSSRIGDCSITFSFNRIDTKGRTNVSERSYGAFCSDIQKFIDQSKKSFKKDEPTATKVTYKTKIN